MREHGEGDVAVPGVVAADLVVVEAGLVLGGLEALLDGPAGPGDADQLLVGGAGRGAAQVVGQFQLALGVRGQRAADQQVPGPAGRLGAVFGQGRGRPVVDPGAFGAVSAAAALPCLVRGVRGQDVGAGRPGVAARRPGSSGRRRRSRSGAAPASPGTCRPCRRPRPRSPRPRARPRPAPGPASAGRARSWRRTARHRGRPPRGSGPGRPSTISAGKAPGRPAPGPSARHRRGRRPAGSSPPARRCPSTAAAPPLTWSPS